MNTYTNDFLEKNDIQDISENISQIAIDYALRFFYGKKYEITNDTGLFEGDCYAKSIKEVHLLSDYNKFADFLKVYTGERKKESNNADCKSSWKTVEEGVIDVIDYYIYQEIKTHYINDFNIQDNDTFMEFYSKNFDEIEESIATVSTLCLAQLEEVKKKPFFVVLAK